MTTKIDISYYGNDFFYSEAERTNKMPSKERCNNLKTDDPIWTDKCNSSNFSNNLQDCIDKELCIYKTNFESNNKIISIQNTSYEKYLNTKEFYNKEIKNSKKYNLYLKNKLKQIEESGYSGDENKLKNDKVK